MKKYIDALKEVFTTASDKQAANHLSRNILEEMSGDPGFLTAVLGKHLTTPGSLNTRHYPVVSLDIELNHLFGLVANCWIPLPNRATDVSTKAIHHHGNMLLSTVTAFGPGYEHWTFQRPTEVNRDFEAYSLNVIERAMHPLHHIAFVDSYVAHLPFYPSAMTITYALWSSKFPASWKDRVKRLPLLQKNSQRLRSLASHAGLAKQLDLKLAEYFDFYPTTEGFRGIRERKEFERGPNEDYLNSLFHVIQETENDQLVPLLKQQLESSLVLENPQLVKHLIFSLEHGQPITGRLSPGHHGIAGANFTKQDIERALIAQQDMKKQTATV